MLTLQKPDCEQAYLSVERLIYKLAHQFSKTYGGDVDELISEGNWTFVNNIYPNWDPEKSKLTTYTQHSVWRRLLSYRRRTMKKQGYQFSQSEDTDENNVPQEVQDFDLKEFVEGLSSDAQAVVRFVVHAPKRVQDRVEEKGGHAMNWSSTLREFLTELCWSLDDIRETFQELEYSTSKTIKPKKENGYSLLCNWLKEA